MTTREEELEDFNKYEADIIDTDDLVGADVKINPDYYIHETIAALKIALVNPNVQEGFLQYRILVEHLEVLTWGSDRLPKDYDKKISDYIASKRHIEELNNLNKGFNLAKEKFKLIFKQVSASKTATSIMKA